MYIIVKLYITVTLEKNLVHSFLIMRTLHDPHQSTVTPLLRWPEYDNARLTEPGRFGTVFPADMHCRLMTTGSCMLSLLAGHAVSMTALYHCAVYAKQQK